MVVLAFSRHQFDLGLIRHFKNWQNLIKICSDIYFNVTKILVSMEATPSPSKPKGLDLLIAPSWFLDHPTALYLMHSKSVVDILIPLRDLRQYISLIWSCKHVFLWSYFSFFYLLYILHVVASQSSYLQNTKYDTEL